jgi:hypothetical protein
MAVTIGRGAMASVQKIVEPLFLMIDGVKESSPVIGLGACVDGLRFGSAR